MNRFAQWRQYIQGLGVNDQSPNNSLSNRGNQFERLQGFFPGGTNQGIAKSSPFTPKALNILSQGATLQGFARTDSERLPPEGATMSLWTRVLGSARRLQL